MFETLQAAAADPILGLMARFREDQRAHKVDLGVGVYRDPSGRTPVMRAVHAAERLRLEEEDSKSYQGMLGDVAFDAAIQSLCFGPSEAGIADRLATVHTPGGTAALRTAADLVRAARPDARVWLADPSWDNHAPIFRARFSQKEIHHQNDLPQGVNQPGAEAAVVGAEHLTRRHRSGRDTPVTGGGVMD